MLPLRRKIDSQNFHFLGLNKKILRDRRYDKPLYPFIQGSLEWPYSKFFSANVLL